MAPRRRLYLIALIILLAGLGSAAAIYLTVPNDTEEVLGYDGIAPENTKTYTHDLELFGGKANVLAVSFTRWFAGLWHGRSLARVIAGFSILISLAFFFAAGRWIAVTSSDAPDEHSR